MCCLSLTSCWDLSTVTLTPLHESVACVHSLSKAGQTADSLPHPDHICSPKINQAGRKYTSHWIHPCILIQIHQDRKQLKTGLTLKVAQLTLSLQHVTPKRGGHTVIDPGSPTAEHFSPQAGMCWRDTRVVSSTIQNSLCCSCSYRHPEISCPGLNTPKYHKYPLRWILHQRSKPLKLLCNSQEKKIAGSSSLVPVALGADRTR